VGTPVCRGEGGRGSRMAGGWVAEGGGRGGGGGGLHSSNGMREPLSNRCRGGARSPRWLLRTLMSFSLGPRPPSLRHPVRPATHSTAPASSSSTFDAALCAIRRCAAAAAATATATITAAAAVVALSFSLALPYSRLLTAAGVLFLRPLRFLSSSLAPREAAMTRVNLPQTPDRYRRTSAFLSLSLSLSLLLRFFLRPTADNCHPASPPRTPPSLPPSLLPLAAVAVAAHPATNLLRMLALCARLAPNV